MRVAICDGDQGFLLGLRKKLRGYLLVSEVELYSDSVSFLNEAQEEYDLVFINLNWNGPMNGLHIAVRLGEMHVNSKVIFITDRLKQNVQELFLSDTNMRGILLKPIEDEYLTKYLEIIDREIKSESEQSVIVNERGRTIAIPFANITHLESNNHMIEIHTVGRDYRVYEPLTELQQRLPETFLRCHRSYVLNVKYIQDYGSNKIVMYDGREIPMGRTYRTTIDTRYKQYLESKKDKSKGL